MTKSYNKICEILTTEQWLRYTGSAYIVECVVRGFKEQRRRTRCTAAEHTGTPSAQTSTLMWILTALVSTRRPFATSAMQHWQETRLRRQKESNGNCKVSKLERDNHANKLEVKNYYIKLDL